MAQTANYGFEKPSTDKDVDEEFYQLQETLDLLDAILAALQTAVNGKSALGHTHAISDIVNLAAELAAKMPASQTFKLDDLTDVDGADGAPNNYVLVKTALGWLPSSALAALGPHGHLISEITGLVDALAGKADAGATATALDNRLRFDAAQTLTDPQKTQARDNIGFTPALAAYNRWETVPGGLVNLAGVSMAAWTQLSAFERLRLTVNVVPQAGSLRPFLRFSQNAGVSWNLGASDYSWAGLGAANTTVAAAVTAPASYFPLTSVDVASNVFEAVVELTEFNKALATIVRSESTLFQASDNVHARNSIWGYRAPLLAHNALQFSNVAGLNFTSGFAHLEGIRG